MYKLGKVLHIPLKSGFCQNYDEVEITNPNFIGEFCKECMKKYNRCCVYKSDCEEDLIDVEVPKAPTNKPNL